STLESNSNHTDVLSGNAEFDDDIFENCTSSDFGGAINFRSDGILAIHDIDFRSCSSSSGKGGVVYVIGNGEHKLSEISFRDCSTSGQLNAEGGSMYIEGGTNTLKDVDFKSSKVAITIKNEDSISKGGALVAVGWLSGSMLDEVDFRDCSAGIGGAIYLDSAASRVEIVDSNFRNNAASIDGGGAIYVRDTTLIHLNDVKFINSSSIGIITGNDLHFSELGVSADNINMTQIQQDVVTKSKS
ncbi:MAG: hypothetical protein EZS28_054040, partial [Streblomastix strix]